MGRISPRPGQLEGRGRGGGGGARGIPIYMTFFPMRYLPRTQAPLFNILFTQWEIGRFHVPQIHPFDPDALGHEAANVTQNCQKHLILQDT